MCHFLELVWISALIRVKSQSSEAYVSRLHGHHEIEILTFCDTLF